VQVKIHRLKFPPEVCCGPRTRYGYSTK